ncbi:MAG: hypothetical protein KBD76_09150 [Bacteriovorax sp.]|nr:hypothetical protein [Bacteriovorax sp.]
MTNIYKFTAFFFFLFFFQFHCKAEELILNNDPSFNPTFQNRYSFLFGLNPNINRAADISNLTFSYGKEMEHFWIDSNFSITRGLFRKITTNNAAATGRSQNEQQDEQKLLTTFGIGVGRITQYAQSLLPFKDMHELMAANLTYSFYRDSNTSKFFYGPGLLAKCSLYKKFSDYFSAGAQFTYNLSVVKRAQDNDTETSSSRSLTMSYLTIGLDLSFYL